MGGTQGGDGASDSTTPPTEAAAWYPDPSRTHELRYFDGTSWTDDVTDAGSVSRSPLGPVRPGLLRWPSPREEFQTANARSYLPPVPRLKMWVLAVLSLVIVPIPLGAAVLVLPVGPAMARWCWWATDDALNARQNAHSSEVTEIFAARGLAAVFAAVSFATFVIILIRS
jgi:hypothetical protein